MLLALLMLTHWLAAITLVPAIFSIVRPRFMTTEAPHVESPEAKPAHARAVAE
jgi:hypothetical protein